MAFFDCVDMFSVVSFGIVKDWSALNLEDKKNWEENFSPFIMGPVAKGLHINPQQTKSGEKRQSLFTLTLSTQSITEYSVMGNSFSSQR